MLFFELESIFWMRRKSTNTNQRGNFMVSSDKKLSTQTLISAPSCFYFFEQNFFLIVFFISISTLFPSASYAQAIALEPQNRLLAGYTFNDGNQGVGIGFDSRLTQLIYINIGTFFSITDRKYTIDETEPSSLISLSNGIYAAPGLRFPHRYKSDRTALNWDILFRTGFACVSSQNALDENWFLVEPAALVGIDLQLKKYNYGFSLSSKAFRYRVDISSLQETLYVIRPQVSAVLFYQW